MICLKREIAKEAVTKYGKEIDRLIVEQVKSDYPDHSLLTEEGGFLRGDPERLKCRVLVCNWSLRNED